MAKAMPLSQYLIQQLSADNPLATQEDRVKLLNDAEPILRQIVAPRSAMFMRKKIAELAQISEAEVQDLLKLPQPSKAPMQARQKQSRAPLSIKKRFMLAALMRPAQMQEDDLKLILGEDAESRLLHAVIEAAIAQPQAKPSALLRAVSQQHDERLVQEISRELLLLDESLDIGLELAGMRTQLMGATQTHQSKQILNALKEKTFAALTEEEREQLRRLTQKSG